MNLEVWGDLFESPCLIKRKLMLFPRAKTSCRQIWETLDGRFWMTSFCGNLATTSLKTNRGFEFTKLSQGHPSVEFCVWRLLLLLLLLLLLY